ncbi:SRPBCC family protein [Myxococcaceae bacterium GXIMD 01537]
MTTHERELLHSPRPPRPADINDIERVLSAIAGVGMVGMSLKRGPLSKLAFLASGAALLKRGISGRRVGLRELGRNLSTLRGGEQGVVLKERITVQRDRADVFRTWRRLENLPSFMKNVLSVEPLGEGRSRWRLRGLLGKPEEWVARLTEERDGALLSWATEPDSAVKHEGSVRFRDAPGGQGTEVEVTLRYEGRGGPLGLALARVRELAFHRQLAEDLLRFKEQLEAGDVTASQAPPTKLRSHLNKERPSHR